MNSQRAFDFTGCADGRTYAHARDHERLSCQRVRVAGVLLDGHWWTLGQLADVIGAPEASVSARLRDLRKPQFGSHIISRRYRGGGLWEYRMEVQP